MRGSSTSLTAKEKQSGDYNKCRHFLIHSQIQKFCTKRNAAKALMVHKNGKPDRNGVNEVNVQVADGGPQLQNSTKQNQQFQQPQVGMGQSDGGAQGYLTQHQGAHWYFVPSPRP
jgi:hypothetical protein